MDSGLLFWDGVHMTPYGQALSAELIANAVLEHFEFAEGGLRSRN